MRSATLFDERLKSIEGKRMLIHRRHVVMRHALPGLRGRPLACWCRLDRPCHADVLLELPTRPCAVIPSPRRRGMAMDRNPKHERRHGPRYEARRADRLALHADGRRHHGQPRHAASVVVGDQLDLRRIATILREFANRLEVISDPRRFEQRTAILVAKTERKFAQDKPASKPKRR